MLLPRYHLPRLLYGILLSKMISTVESLRQVKLKCDQPRLMVTADWIE